MALLGVLVQDTEKKNRLLLDNPWWTTGALEGAVQRLARRAFVFPFLERVQNGGGVAAVLSGPGRAGKTVLIKQVIGRFMDAGVAPRSLIYLSLNNPAFANMDLVDLTDLALAVSGSAGQTGAYVFLDDIHNVPAWEQRLDALARARPACRMIAVSGLVPVPDPENPNLFAHSILPPVLFAEYLHILRIRETLFDPDGRLQNLEGLNTAFVDYINCGGFPEVAFAQGRDVRLTDVVAGIVHCDLAGLCGIADQREVAKLMTRLALESGLETSIESLSADMNVAKNTLRKYLEFLESAYLIKRIWRVDGEGKRFQRQTRFKVYLTSPALRSGLAGPVAAGDEALARLAETAVISQFMHSPAFHRLFYAFWKKGRKHMRVSLVEMPPKGKKPVKCIELDWSNASVVKPLEVLGDLVEFLDVTHPTTPSKVLTRNMSGKRFLNGHEIGFMPVSVWCYAVGQVLLTGQSAVKQGAVKSAG